MSNRKKPESKRPIDKLRDGAGSFVIGTPDDQTAISGMLSIKDERLLIVKGKGIYEVEFADQIDPERTNIEVPNTIQKVLSYGSDHEWVGRVLLTANELLKDSIIGKEVDCGRSLELALEISQDIAASLEVAESYNFSEQNALKEFNAEIRKDRSVVLPAIAGADAMCKEFLQKTDHSLRELFSTVKLFYPKVGTRGWDSLRYEVERETDRTDNFLEFIDNALPILRFVRNARNCVEHPREGYKVEVSNFSINSQNTLIPPTVSIDHPKTPLNGIPLSVFFRDLSAEIITIVELMYVYLCMRKVKPFAGLPFTIYEMPENSRKHANIRFGYGVCNGDDIVPVG